jgi:alpha-methylacyl-CoA racemase
MTSQPDTSLLRGIKVVNLGLNTPGPVAAARLAQLGAEVTKVEPPSGDPLKNVARTWYDQLCHGQTVLTLNLKDATGQRQLHDLLAGADLLLASFRPSALIRLGLDWENIHRRHPRLCFVGIVGYLPPHEERSGHDLTYQCGLGLLTPPHMPASLYVDLAGAEHCVSQALALLLKLARSGESGYAWVSLYDCAVDLTGPIKAGLTVLGGLLGGGYPLYGFYQASDGWIAIAALEPQFAKRLISELNLAQAGRSELERIFLQRSASAWAAWAAERDLPLVAVGIV